jgi:ABC-2 type transport system ATP-binding protein
MATTDPGAPAIRARGLRRSFRVALGLKSVEVLHGLDLDLARGQFLGLVGPNGSGKSTLLRVLAGIDPANAGELAVLGGDPDSDAVKQRVAFLPEDSPFPGELKPLAVLDLLGSLYRIPRRERRQRAERLLERVGLADSRRTPLARFSRGMLRRFGLAQAFLNDAELFLLDEPTAGLDALGFAVVDELLGEARARGAAVVIASHLWTDLHRHCERLAVLIDGRFVASGAPLELVRSLGADARLDVTLEGASERALDALRAAATGAGARVVGVGPNQANLVELYRRLGARGRA